MRFHLFFYAFFMRFHAFSFVFYAFFMRFHLFFHQRCDDLAAFSDENLAEGYEFVQLELCR